VLHCLVAWHGLSLQPLCHAKLSWGLFLLVLLLLLLLLRK
jgi:hypothetical protein